MRIVALLGISIVVSVAAGCSGGGKTTPTVTPSASAPSPTASAAVVTPPAVPSAGATAAQSPAAGTAFPGRCSELVSNADVDALAAQHLQSVGDSLAGSTGSISQLVCRFQGAGTGADTAMIIIAAAYPDATAAHDDDAVARQAAEAQGGSFTPLAGIGDEAYSFSYPTLSGVAAREGRLSVSIGVGKLLGVPATGEFKPLLQSLFVKLGG